MEYPQPNRRSQDILGPRAQVLEPILRLHGAWAGGAPLVEPVSGFDLSGAALFALFAKGASLVAPFSPFTWFHGPDYTGLRRETGRSDSCSTATVWGP